MFEKCQKFSKICKKQLKKLFLCAKLEIYKGGGTMKEQLQEHKKHSAFILGMVILVVLSLFLFSRYGKKKMNSVEQDSSTYLEYNSKEKYTSLYSESNAPEFYGMTKAVMQKGTVFDLSLAYLRIFAKDFEDGDLTPNIEVVSNNVDTSKVGNYEVKYKVTDSDNNTTSITVPVEIVDNGDENYFERTLYTLPDIAASTLTGARGRYMDHQIIGFMLEAGKTMNVKKISGPDLTLQTYRDNENPSNSTINTSGVDLSYDKVSTAFFMTPYGDYDESVVGITIKTEDMIGMPYYHYKDDEAAFREYWTKLKENGNTVGLVEGYSVQYFILPTEMPDTGFKAFGTIDAGLEFFDRLTNEYDELLGFKYDAEHLWEQNVKMKYFMIGGGANNGTYAYYSDYRIVKAGSSSPSSNLFQKGWATMHEIAHGSEGGGLNGGNMGLVEVSNNILAYYAMSKSDMHDEYFANEADRVGDISVKEVSINNNRLNGKTFTSLDSGGKLYVLVNLLNTYDYKETYAKIASLSRQLSIEGKYSDYSSLPDRYVLAYHELYGVNVSSYFEAWGLEVSQNAKEVVKNDKTAFMLADAVNDDELANTIKDDLNLEGKYSLVTHDELDKYNLKTTLKININIDNIDMLKGKYILLVGGSNTYKVPITDSKLEVEVNAGVYQVTVPIPRDNVYTYDSYATYNCVNNKENSYEITYTKNENNLLTFDAIMYLAGQGSFANVTFDKDNVIITTTGDATHWYFDDNYATIKILDESDNEVFYKEYKGKIWTTKGVDKIPYKVGYKIIIYHQEGNASNKFNILHKYTNTAIPNLTKETGENTYVIGEYGLYQVEKNSYPDYKAVIDEYAKKLENDLTQEELSDKNKKRNEKSILLNSIYKLKEEDIKEYKEKYNYIFNGSSPSLSTNTITLEQNASTNIYSLLKGVDLEDGTFTLNNTNFTYDKFSTNSAGTYNINYTLKDLDNNVTNGTLTVVVNEKKEEEKEEVTPTPDNTDKEEIPSSESSTSQEKDKEQSSSDKNTSTNSSSKVEATSTSNSKTQTNSSTVTDKKEDAQVSNSKEEIKKEDAQVSNSKEEIKKEEEQASDSKEKNEMKEETEESKNSEIHHDSKSEVKEKTNFIDKWLDDEYTPSEMVICTIFIVVMATILAYFKGRRM
jgi:hypothetical protein